MKYFYGDWYDILCSSPHGNNPYREYTRPAEVTDELFYFSTGMGRTLDEINTLGVCNEVLGHDCYGFRKLSNKGFSPKFVLDVGGHIGTASLMMKRIWPDCRILSVESNPYTCSVNRLNSEKFNGWEIKNWTLVGFHEYERYDNFANITIRNSSEFEKNVRNGHHDETTAPGISVKEFLSRYGDIKRINLLKIDVEGSEAMIISELKYLGLLPNIDVIVGEWHYVWVREHLRKELSDTHAFFAKEEHEFNSFHAKIRRD